MPAKAVRVGERGPEVFVPAAPGRITRTLAMGNRRTPARAPAGPSSWDRAGGTDNPAGQRCNCWNVARDGHQADCRLARR